MLCTIPKSAASGLSKWRVIPLHIRILWNMLRMHYSEECSIWFQPIASYTPAYILFTTDICPSGSIATPISPPFPWSHCIDFCSSSSRRPFWNYSVNTLFHFSRAPHRCDPYTETSMQLGRAPTYVVGSMVYGSTEQGHSMTWFHRSPPQLRIGSLFEGNFT